MQRFIREAWDSAIATTASARGNVDLPYLACRWAKDKTWARELARVPASKRRSVLAEFGTELFDKDAGNYASELRWNTGGLSPYWDAATREIILRRHAAHLLAGISDSIDLFDLSAASYPSADVSTSGVEHLEGAMQAGRGAILLGAYQSHPGFLLLSPLLARHRVAAIQHSNGDDIATRATALHATRSLQLLPAVRSSMRAVLDVVTSGGIVVMYNDFIYPETSGISAPFFGKEVLVSRAILSLAIKTGAPIVPFAVARGWPPDSSSVHLDFFAPLSISGHALQSHQERVRSAALVASFATECLVRRYPSVWRLWNTLEHRWVQTAAAT